MCGICGIICWDNKKEISLPLLKKMANTLSHRGPDDDGFYIENIDGFKVGIGHRRLSIIDLVTGKQPIFNEDKSILTILNGEIYNFPSLREELIKNGHIFQTKSDTEVIVHLYEEMGIDFLKKLSGMFSIAIFDKKNKRLLLARDRVGKKPLYYCQQDGWFAFGSEIKAIKILPFSPDKIDPFSIDDYLSYG
ncbi:MAG: asparagine synthetase B, partial [Spirochaetes bacterium]